MNERYKNYGALIFAGICFGTTGTAQALGPSGTSPLVVGAARLLFGSIFLWVIHVVLKTKSSRIGRLELLVGGASVALYQIAFFSAVRSTGVAVGTLTAIGSAPALTGVLGFLINKELPSRRWLTATVITTIGIVFLTGAKGLAHFNISGVLLALGAGASYSLFAVASKRALNSGISFTQVMYKIFGVGAIALAPFFFIGKSHFLETTSGISLALWLGLVPTAIAYTSYGFGLNKIKVATASTLILAEPATATLLAAVVLGESLNSYSWIGVVIVASGLIYLARE
jgi:drug/metabolite transporter, DME family